MTTQVEPTFDELGKLCFEARSQMPKFPDLTITFSSGGLFMLGVFQKAGFPKTPAIALPWTRRQIEGDKYEITGAPLWDHITYDQLLRVETLAIVDDIFDTGATIFRVLSEIRKFGIMWNTSSIFLLAPYRKQKFWVADAEAHTCTGSCIENDIWIKFPWET